MKIGAWTLQCFTEVRMRIDDCSAGEPIFIIEMNKFGERAFKTYPHNVEAATVHIEYLKMLEENENG